MAFYEHFRSCEKVRASSFRFMMACLFFYAAIMCGLEFSTAAVSKFHRLLNYDNYDVISNKIYQSQDGDIHQCAETCAHLPSCSLFYHSPMTSSCKFSSATLLPDPSNGTHTPGSRYYRKMEDWCPDTEGWIKVDNSQQPVCYQVSSQLMSWDDARKYCKTLGGKLVVLHETWKRVLIAERIEDYATKGRYVWIGLSDAATEGVYEWTDGSVSVAGDLLWADNQPNGGQSENCGSLTDGEVVDSLCSLENRCVCEKH